MREENIERIKNMFGATEKQLMDMGLLREKRKTICTVICRSDYNRLKKKSYECDIKMSRMVLESIEKNIDDIKFLKEKMIEEEKKRNKGEKKIGFTMKVPEQKAMELKIKCNNSYITVAELIRLNIYEILS